MTAERHACIFRLKDAAERCGEPAYGVAEIELHDTAFDHFAEEARRHPVPLCKKHFALLASMPGVGGAFSLLGDPPP
jgi:hypothetical protein